MKIREELQQQWHKIGEQYAKAINEMVAYGNEYGWENWKGEEPQDNRENLAEEVLVLLREANSTNSVEEIRELFAPAHAPFVSMLDKKGSYIGDISALGEDCVVFMKGTSYEDRQAYMVCGREVTKLNSSICSIGKAMNSDVIAIAYADHIEMLTEWNGELISSCALTILKEEGITRLVPFNDGKKVLVVTSEGVYLLDSKEEKLVFPEEFDEEMKEDGVGLSMENATLSFNNKYIVVGDQNADHIILDSDGNKVGSIGPQSSYPHYCLFTKDDRQLMTNSCHFYNGISIGIDATQLEGIDIPGWEENELITYLDESMRVYAGVSTNDYYILGDAYGYIRAINKEGKELWQYFLGSTISGIAMSHDETILYVGTYAGILHKLIINKPVRDTHVIGTGNLYEDYRLLLWKEEDNELFW
ncbi:hypothetical protein [Myroides pelagicus]|uniref:PQQ-binding-like beta-propeller repeat protein n=1 Tax=Myroides pelagicus TaxID=270914 RepID=A0A7K1GNA1_9FLAO|nr:hypothetical protein [Myroides pelagicus]MEC4113106.1 hypothetical protein [Myroides pelagicus]MTH30009.1 hypothetical protein [Myroides pelagicus]